MKRKLLALILTMTMVLTACGDTADKTAEDNTGGETQEAQDEAAQDGGSWAVYMYMCGSDLESKYGFATNDLNELTDVTLPENVTFVIETGGASEWQNETISADHLSRLVYTGNDLEVIDEMESANMGDPATLEDFLTFCNKSYPADHKMVLFWDHGGGAAAGVLQDENFDGDSLTLPELDEAFHSTCESSETDQPYDIIGFDTCLMATLEVAGIFKDIGKYLVASEETEPGIGWSYDGWVGKFNESDHTDPVELGKTICDTYYKACQEYEVDKKVTLSLTDLSKIRPVLDAYSAFGDEALTNMMNNDDFYADFDRYAQKTQNYGGNTDKSGYSDMADLGDLAKKCEKIMPSSAETLETALSDAVLYQIMGKYRKQASGLSCYYPYSYSKKLYNGYHKSAASKSFEYYFQYLLKDKISDSGKEYIRNLLEGSQGSESIPPKKTVGKKELDNHKVKIVGGDTAELNLGPDVAKYLSGVFYQLIVVDGESYMCLGDNDNLTYDWDNGVFRDDFDGTWGSIDGKLVFMDVSESNDDYSIYSIPIKLNGEMCFLDCAIDKSTLEGSILGVESGIQNGVAAKDYTKLKVGDEITTQIGVSTDGDMNDIKFVDVDTITVTEDTSFAMTDLGEATYGLVFEMRTAEGKNYTSEAEIFVVEDGKKRYLK